MKRRKLKRRLTAAGKAAALEALEHIERNPEEFASRVRFGLVVATIAAAALPKDKADLVIESINKHMEARAAEAKAEAGVVDTEGTSVA